MSNGIVELKIVPSTAQRFVQDLGPKTYNFRLTWNDAGVGTWNLDIGDENQNLLVAGIPLVTGVDLLGQYRHLGFPGGLVVTSDADTGDIPTFDGLGVTSRVFFVPD
ncbi:phage baseplate plug protein [Methylobacterium sp. J-076]|uniref:phage baseplate plug family protein n=1 Tax=Methylobacterium sp. J-076 TaxID=2836655 RepID=UPI001FBAA95D|nr:hypothetical protein [Methylobacterium sp. J-076]MCJ2012667.1 hypothetical protein [Methylobacterium sp. J-076]